MYLSDYYVFHCLLISVGYWVILSIVYIFLRPISLLHAKARLIILVCLGSILSALCLDTSSQYITSNKLDKLEW